MPAGSSGKAKDCSMHR